jgi:hypothetical protein
MTVLDSHHAQDHVLAEFRHYGALTAGGSCIVVTAQSWSSLQARQLHDQTRSGTILGERRPRFLRRTQILFKRSLIFLSMRSWSKRASRTGPAPSSK